MKSDRFDIGKRLSEVDMSSGAVQPEADLEGGTLMGAVDSEAEAGGHITTSDTDDGDRALVKNHKFIRLLLLRIFHLCNIRDRSFCIFIRVRNLRVLACGKTKSLAYNAPSVLSYDSAVCHACQMAANQE